MFKQSFKRVICFLIALTMVLSLCMVASADTDGANAELYQRVYTGTVGASGEYKYETSGGGSVSGSELWVQNGVKVTSETSIVGDTPLEVNDAVYGTLSKDSQRTFVKRIMDSANDLLDEHDKDVKENGAEYGESWANSETVKTFYQNLQVNSTVGTQLMSDVLAGTKPDFVSAQKIYEPFQGVIGTVMGILSILIISLLGLVMVLDIAYIVLPPFRMLVGGEGGGDKKGFASSLISSNAKKAVETAESEDKQALVIYFKKQVIALIVLGICLLYLINGQIYTLVGWILDMVSGFLGF